MKHPSRAGHEDAWCKRLAPEVVDGRDLCGADGSGVDPDFIDEAAVEVVFIGVVPDERSVICGDSFLRRKCDSYGILSSIVIDPPRCSCNGQAHVLPHPKLEQPRIDYSIPWDESGTTIPNLDCQIIIR